MAPEDLEKFHTNLKEVLGYVKYANNKEQLENYISQDQEFQKLDRDAVNVINSCTGSNITLEKGAVKVDTCQAIKDIREEGMVSGVIVSCKDFDFSREKTKQKLMEKCHLSEEKAEEYLKKFW
jgi:carbamoylphosphate synthase small subunit